MQIGQSSIFRVAALRRKGEAGRAAYWLCPRCQVVHSVPLDRPTQDGQRFKWNNDFYKPTLAPSVRFQIKYGSGGSLDVCHSVIRSGNVEYLRGTDGFDDMPHKVLPLPALPNYEQPSPHRRRNDLP